MNRRGKPRKFPYYVVTDIDTTKRRMQILDLNSIQKEEYTVVEGKEKKIVSYEPDASKHDLKWIDVPGKTQKEQDQTINWIKDMVFLNGEKHPDKYMVYDHRRHFTDPLHEENKVNAFRQWEDENFVPDEEDAEIEAETVEEDE